ncbi:MAG: molybdopterin-dependent oxidoreductase [Chloroflexota bacterium]|nr:molybdopterin-dependent oxidoreductase [Chloroflexota bacterium]
MKDKNITVPDSGADTGLTRRDFVKAGAFLGGVSVLASQVPWLMRAGRDGGGLRYLRPTEVYPLAQPENIIYSVCLQCNTQCTIKAKQTQGIAVKLDGNPYSPFNLLPQIDYATPPADAARVDGKVCPKGQSGVQSQYDPYRIRKVLKRAGPRGSGKWKTIPFDQAVAEIVSGGKLFSDIGEDRQVMGLKDVFVLRDAAVAKAMSADVAEIQSGKMTVAAFKTKHRDHLDVLIDPDHPDLGPKNNQFVFMAGRIEPSRDTFAQRFTTGGLGSVNWYNHTSICELSHHIAYLWSTAQYTKGKWAPGVAHCKPNYAESEFVIFWGTGAFEANFGPTPMAEQVTAGLASGRLKIAVVDPRLSKTAAKAWRWLPAASGGDLPLALGMIRWIFDNQRYDAHFLGAANKAAATALGEPSWTGASWLVRLDAAGTPGRFLRAADAGLAPPAGVAAADAFVVSQGGKLVAVDPYDEKAAVVGDLFAEMDTPAGQAKTALALLRDAAAERTVEEWSKLAGVPATHVTDVANEFTSHGKRAAIDFYRGVVAHTNGFHAAQALIALNLLIGNPDWKGGLSAGGGAWNAMGGKKWQPFDLGTHPGKLAAFGVKLTREGSSYDHSTLFSTYPAQRPWFPLTSNIYHEVIPAAGAKYPYPIKILWLHMGNPFLLAPAGSAQIPIARDLDAIPLLIATDIVVGDSTMYADYLFPDTSYMERWAALGPPPSVVTKTSLVRQPAAPPVPETVTVDGEPMPISMEAVMIAAAKRLGATGFGAGALGSGWALNRPEDFYLKLAANVAAGDSATDAVPDASDADLALFRAARRHLPAAVFDEAKWTRAVGADNWRRTVYVLARGGRFEAASKAYAGALLGHRFGKLWSVYSEPVGTTRDSMTGQAFAGVPRYQPLQDSLGKPLASDGYPFDMLSFKEIFGAKRTVSNYWSQLALLPENFVLIAKSDAARLRLSDGDRVRIVSPSNPEGAFDLGALGKRSIEGKVRAIEGLRPGTIEVSLSYGHWGYGGSDVVVDGSTVRDDARRTTGLCTNAVLLLDPAMKTTPLTDPIGGSASFFDTKVKLQKV